MDIYEQLCKDLQSFEVDYKFYHKNNKDTLTPLPSTFTEHTEETKVVLRIKAQNRIKKGEHNFLDSEWQKSKCKKQVENGTHNFLNKEWQAAQNKKRIENGTHNFLNPEARKQYTQKQLANGNHVTQNSEIQSAKSKKAWSNMPRVTCPHCGKAGAKPVMSRYHFAKCKSLLQHSN